MIWGAQGGASNWPWAWAPAQIGLFTATRSFLTGEDGDNELDWITDERRRVAELVPRALEAYGTACLELGGAELSAAIRVGRRLVQSAPLRASGTRLLIQHWPAEGNRAEALHVYEITRRTLSDQLGIDPNQPTQALYAELNR
jgi:DNA-binding SARP family transcriptional activator